MDGILDAVARQPAQLTLSDVAAAIGAPVSSTRDLLSALEVRGYLRRDGMRYEIAHRPRTLTTIAASPELPDHDELVRLSTAARAPLLLAVLAGTEVYYLDHAGPRAPARLQDVVDRHLPRPALRTAAGRVMLALGRPSTATRRQLQARDRAGYREYERAAPRIREARLARSEGLADADIRAIAVPVENATDAALVVTGRRRGASDRSIALDAAARRLLAALRERD